MIKSTLHVEDNVDMNIEEYLKRINKVGAKIIGTPLRGGGVITFNIQHEAGQNVFNLFLKDENMKSISFERL